MREPEQIARAAIGRTEVSKTLIFAKDDSHAESVLEVANDRRVSCSLGSNHFRLAHATLIATPRQINSYNINTEIMDQKVPSMRLIALTNNERGDLFTRERARVLVSQLHAVEQAGRCAQQAQDPAKLRRVLVDHRQGEPVPR